MINTRLLSIGLVTLTIITASAVAKQGSYLSGAIAYSQALGMPDMDTSSASSYGDYTMDQNSQNAGYRFSYGYSYDLTSFFGLGGELGYNNYGNEKYSASNSQGGDDLTYKFSAIDLLAKATWHVNPAWDLYGKLGVALETLKVNNDTIGDNNRCLPEAGVGVSYFITDSLAVDLAAYYTSGSDIRFNKEDDNNLPSMLSADLGISYYFS